MAAHSVFKRPIAAVLSRCFGTSTVSVQRSGPGLPSSVLSLVNSELAAPAANEVQVKMLAAPISGFDLASVKGLRAGAGCGNEGVGIVTSVGSNVTGVLKNDHVVPVTPGVGTWATNINVDAGSVVTVSKEIPAEQAAMISGTGCLAFRLLEDFVTLSAGDVIVQNDAKSSVAKAIIQIAAKRGVQTINIIPDHPDSDKTTEHLYSLGANIVVTESYLSTPKYNKLTAELGAPKLGINSRGGSAASNLAKSLGDGATMVTYAGYRSEPVSIPTSTLLDKGLTVKGFSYSRYLETATPEAKAEMVSTVSGLVQDGTITNFVLSSDFDNFFTALSEAEFEFAERASLVKMA